jgi:hypothetical protein
VSLLTPLVIEKLLYKLVIALVRLNNNVVRIELVCFYIVRIYVVVKPCCIISKYLIV